SKVAHTYDPEQRQPDLHQFLHSTRAKCFSVPLTRSNFHQVTTQHFLHYLGYVPTLQIHQELLEVMGVFSLHLAYMPDRCRPIARCRHTTREWHILDIRHPIRSGYHRVTSLHW